MTRDDASLPKTYETFVERFPKIAEAHQNTARALADAGPLDDRAIALVKLGICVGAGLESAVKSHVRRALDAGASAAEIEQVLVLGVNSIGFPSSVAAWQWGSRVLEDSKD
jgi:alkylhydroperoxidase/carboxymuconolactone decarboxylase family protein YurZ